MTPPSTLPSFPTTRVISDPHRRASGFVQTVRDNARRPSLFEHSEYAHGSVLTLGERGSPVALAAIALRMKNKIFITFAFIVIATLFTPAQAKTFPTIKELMSPEEFKAAGLTKLSDQEIAALDIWVQKHSLRVAQVVVRQAGTGSKATLSFDQLEECSIVADDGEFLGIISRNEMDSQSILNAIGKHGSEISSLSIFNTIGKYGSEISALSPFNEIASKPPKIFNKRGKFVAYLSKNTLKTPRVDPHALIGWLKSK